MTANRIRSLRELRGWSQGELGRRIGANKFKISRLESGEQKLDLDVALRIAREFEVTLGEVIGLGETAGLKEDAKRYTPGALDPLSRLADPARNQCLFIVQTRALDELGLSPSDVLLVDTSGDAIARPPPLAVVVCQLFDDAGQAIDGTIMLRQFVPPALLVTNSRTVNTSPVNLGAGQVRVIGVVISRHHSISAGYHF